MSTLTTIRLDPFNPVLAPGTKSLQVTAEQDLYIREVLDICSSDSASAKKAYKALKLILTVGLPADAPTITSLTPNTQVHDVSTVLGVVAVTGTGFMPDSVVLVDDIPGSTAFVSATELSASFNVLPAPASYSLKVQNSDAQVSNAVGYEVTAPV